MVLAPNPTSEPSGAPGKNRHLERSSLFVLINTGATGVLGAGFWLIAARYSSEDDVAAAVAAASLLIAGAFLCQLNLPTALSRYLPGAGRHQHALVVRSYAISLGVSLVAAAAVVAVGLARGGSVVDGGSFALTLVLAASFPIWVIFAMQDGVLVDLRESHWVPVENAVTTVAKFGLLPALVGLGGGAGILLAWTGPALAGIVVITYFLFRRVLPRSRDVDPTGPSRDGLVGARPFVGYALRDFPGAAMRMVSLRLVPILVLEFGDPGDGAFIGLPWTILTVAVLVLPMLSRALLAELSHDESAAEDLMGRATRLVLFGLLPATVVGALLVDPVLSIAGAEYADRGTPILAFGALGVAPTAYFECRLALMRFRHQVMRSSVLQGAQATVLLATIGVLIAVDRVDQIGAAFLAVALFSAFTVDPIDRLLERRAARR